MSNRIDIEILEYLKKNYKSSKNIDLIHFIKEYEEQTIYEYVTQMKIDGYIYWERGDSKQTLVNNECVTVYTFKAKILPKGRDYLLDYNNKNTTRKIAYTALAISVASMLWQFLKLIQ